MKVGLIDVDGHNYPNIPLMKISAYHKAKGDHVEWYQPLFSGHMDIVYMSKVFSFTPDYEYFIDAEKIVKGGTGYAIELINGKEQYNKDKDIPLPAEIEHIYPDYSIYPEQTKDTAYGFLTRGCPRGCDFCHVAPKEGRCSKKVADLSEFWNGQKHIVLCDPNILACTEWKDLLQQLIDSKAKVNFNQGLDIRLMTNEKAEMLSNIKTESIHFAWDRYEDKEIIEPKFKMFRGKSKVHPHNLQVYVLCGDHEKRVRKEDLYRIYWLRENGYAPYVMVYDKEHLPPKHELRRLQRWVNMRAVFWKVPTFEEYQKTQGA
jgi:hypothetical protein